MKGFESCEWRENEMRKTGLIKICLVLVSIGVLSGCSMKSEIRRTEPKDENANTDINDSTDANDLNDKSDIKDEYSMFNISYMDIDDTAVASNVVGENIDVSKIKKETDSEMEDVTCEYENKGLKFSWFCTLSDGKKRDVGFNFFEQEGKKLKIKDSDQFIRNILEKMECRYPVSNGRVVEKEGDSVQIEYDYIYEGTELVGNRGVSFDEEDLSKVAQPPYIMLSLEGDVVKSVDFFGVPEKIKEVKKCKREEFISLDDVAAVTDKAAAYPSAESIDKIEVVYMSLPQNDNFTFSPLYQVKFKNSEEEEVCNWKDLLLIDVFTGRTYR